MTERPRTTMAPARYRQLLETAAREFASAGYERASLNRVIRDRGMSKSSFYHFFESKADLFDAVVREASTEMATALEVPEPEDLSVTDFWERIERLVERLVALAEGGGWYVDLGRILYLPDAPIDTSPALRDALARGGAWLDGALAAGRTAGAVRGDLPASLLSELALAVLRAMDRWSLAHLDEIDPGERERLAHVQVDAIRRLLAP